jgi:hypothetical protein
MCGGGDVGGDGAEGEGMLDNVMQGGMHLWSGVRICWTSWCKSEETLRAAADNHVSTTKLWLLLMSTRTSGVM